MIEQSANRHVLIARDRRGIEAAFSSGGLYAVADRLKCTPEEALDVLINARLVPYVSERRRVVLRQVVSQQHCSHVAVAEALDISRWTVATYRHQLGIDRVPVAQRDTKR
jgi:DNA-binding CsgD family transcriptional regulator